MQERRQNCVAKQSFTRAAGEISTEAQAIPFRTLAIIGCMSGLLDPGPHAFEGEESWVGETLVGQVEFHLGAKRFGVRFVGYINVWYKTENPLMLFRLELLGSNLLRRIGHSH